MARGIGGKSALRTAVSVAVTLAVLGGAGAAVYFGQSALQARVAAQPRPDPAPLTPVAVQELVQVQSYRQERSFVGQIEPRRTVATSFELAGQLQDILVDEGDDIRAGQLIARQDVALLQAERQAAQSTREATLAQLEFALQRVTRAEALQDSGFASRERLDAALATRDELRARVREIDANLHALDIRLAKAELFAPFAGRVTQRFVDGGEALSPGQPVLEVVETAAPLLRVGIPLSVDETTLSGATVLSNGNSYRADFLTLRPDIDAVTRTRTALFALQDAAGLSFGQTAEVVVETQVPTAGTWVPIDSLKEGARGQWTLMVLDEANVVRRATALILHAESDRVYVQGSFADGNRMIADGPQRVVPGQVVTPIPTQEG